MNSILLAGLWHGLRAGFMLAGTWLVCLRTRPFIGAGLARQSFGDQNLAKDWEELVNRKYSTSNFELSSFAVRRRFATCLVFLSGASSICPHLRPRLDCQLNEHGFASIGLVLIASLHLAQLEQRPKFSQ